MRGAGRRRARLPGGGVALAAALAAVLALAAASLFVGVSAVPLREVLAGRPDVLEVFWVSRVPRTVAAVLAGAALAVAGLVMQMVARNRFVEPSTVGTVESAMLGILVVTVLAPGHTPLAKMAVAACFALAGTFLFLALVRRVPSRSSLLVPLVGIMLGGVVSAATTFFAYRLNLLQALNAWTYGDFSGVLRGRYELLWAVGAMAVIGYAAADRFTVAGLGEDVSRGLGVDHRAVVRLGVVVVALIAAVTVTTVGSLPFLGLVVPNAVSLVVGDSARRAVPWAAALGAGLVLACDIAARTVRYPFEVPVGLVMAVVGAAVFLALLAGRRRRGLA